MSQLSTWDHACTVDVRAMDDQHGILMDTMNELSQTVARGCGREKISELLDQLIEFTRMHFWSEEQLMEKAGFPGLAEHRAENHILLARMLEAAHRVQYSGDVQMDSLISLLGNGYLEHIEKHDRQYGPWLNGHGVR